MDIEILLMQLTHFKSKIKSPQWMTNYKIIVFTKLSFYTLAHAHI